MSLVSYNEDNLDARSESLRGRYHHSILPKENTTKKTEESPYILRKKSMESQFKLERRSNSARTSWSKQRQKALPQKALDTSKKNTTKKHRKKTAKSQFTLERRSNSTRTPRSKQRQKASPQKALGNTRQDIRRRKLQKTQHVPVQKIQSVTPEEIERRIQREMIRQSRLKE